MSLVLTRPLHGSCSSSWTWRMATPSITVIKMLVQQERGAPPTEPLPPMLLKTWHTASSPLIDPRKTKGVEGEAGGEGGVIVGVAGAVEGHEKKPLLFLWLLTILCKVFGS